MDLEFADNKLRRLETDQDFNGGYAPAVVSAFRRRMQVIRAAIDERDLYQLKSLVYKKLRGKRSHQKSMRLNDQWRLILEIESREAGQVVVIKGIEDYH